MLGRTRRFVFLASYDGRLDESEVFRHLDGHSDWLSEPFGQDSVLSLERSDQSILGRDHVNMMLAADPR